ncbi:hypothetical protein VN97_g12061, partial [Penicillium thymicola]
MDRAKIWITIQHKKKRKKEEGPQTILLRWDCKPPSNLVSANYLGLALYGRLSMPPDITLSLVVTYNSLLYKDSPTPKLAAKRSANFLQIQFRFNSDSIQIQFRFNSDSIQ